MPRGNDAHRRMTAAMLHDVYEKLIQEINACAKHTDERLAQMTREADKARSIAYKDVSYLVQEIKSLRHGSDPISRQEFIELRDRQVRIEQLLHALRTFPPAQPSIGARIVPPGYREDTQRIDAMRDAVNKNVQTEAGMFAQIARDMNRLEKAQQAAHEWMSKLQTRTEWLDTNCRHLLARTAEYANYIEDLRKRVAVLEQVPVKARRYGTGHTKK